MLYMRPHAKPTVFSSTNVVINKGLFITTEGWSSRHRGVEAPGAKASKLKASKLKEPLQAQRHRGVEAPGEKPRRKAQSDNDNVQVST